MSSVSYEEWDRAAPAPVPDGLLSRLDNWALAGLPQLNVSILDGDLAPTALVDTLARYVFADLPAPEAFRPPQARQLLVHLAFSGASVARHYQERDVAHRATPERARVTMSASTIRLNVSPGLGVS